MIFISVSILSLLVLPILLIIYVTYKLKKRGEHLRKNGIPFLGVGLKRQIKFFSGSKSIVEMEQETYEEALKTGAPFAGVVDFGGMSNLMVTDIELIRAILVKDFDHFVNRRPIGTESSVGYFKKMLFAMRNEQWKGVRAKLSPTFTTGKIRRMFSIFRTSSERMEEYLKRQMDYPRQKSMDIDFLKIFPKYTLDVIASCTFGVDSKSFEVAPDQMSTFEEMAQKFGFKFGGKVFLKLVLVLLAPKVADFFGIDSMDTESQTYFADVIKNVMKRRRETGERREDFLQLMMDARDGLLKEDEESREVMNGASANEGAGISGEGHKKVVFDDDNVIANLLLFLMAGFDPTQSALLFTLYALALEPEVQEKLYLEVESVLNKRGGELTYEAILDMTYLDMLLNETIRRYTPSTRTERYCNTDYKIPGSNTVIEKGSIVLIPIFGIHHDSRYFPNPEKFIPERFLPENKASRHLYMPFGNGPRNCIGMRFALVKVKAVIVQLVRNFQFAPCSKTKIPMEYDRNPNVRPKGDMWLQVTVREG